MNRTTSILSFFSSPLKRFYKFLLKRILGSFLQHDLDLDQLDVQLSKGELELRDLELNVQMLNELCVDLPFTFIRARIRLVRVIIPWRNLLSKSCLLKLDGWDFVVVPSEQVQTRASTSFSTMLTQSVMAVDIDANDLELQKSLASLGQHFRARNYRQSDEPQTPLSMSGTTSTTSLVTEEAEEKKQDGDEHADSAEEETRSVRKHSMRQAAAFDTAKEGLKVVASFLEQVVSAIELEVTDITIRIQHQPRLGHKRTNVIFRLPWVKFSDVNKEEHPRKEDSCKLETGMQLAQGRRLAARQRREAERQRRGADRAARQAAAASSDGAVEDEGDELDPDTNAHLEDAEAEEAEDEAAIRREMELKLMSDTTGSSDSVHLNSGPKFFYHKAIRFHGFRVELVEDACIDSSIAQFHPAAGLIDSVHEVDPTNNLDVSDRSQAEASEPQTIISGSMDQECIITLKLKMQDTLFGEPRLESTCFIQSLRALLTPRQLALLIDLAGAIGLSAKQVALNAQLSYQSALQAAQPVVVLNAAGGFSPSIPIAASLGKQHATTCIGGHGDGGDSLYSRVDPYLVHAHPLSNPDYHIIESLLSQQSGRTVLSPHDRFFDFSDGAATNHPTSVDQVLNMWSMETHILHCSLTLMESDEQSWATDWWSAPTGDVSAFGDLPSPQPSVIVQSVIPGVTSNHLFLSVHHTFINMNQTSAESTVKVAFGSLQLNEFLVQQRAQSCQHGQLPRRMHTPAADAEWIGFKARPLISFTVPVSATPHPSEMEYPGTSADAFLRSTRPVTEPHLSVELRTSVESGHSLSFNEPIVQFFEPHDNGTVNSRITLSCQPATIHFDLGLGERLKYMLDAVSTPGVYLHGGLSQPVSSSSSSENASFTFDLNRINANKQRHSLGSDGASYSQTVIIAPTIHLNVYLPATTPSQLQAHPYTRLDMMTQDPFVDARGILRPERIQVELHEVSITNECEVVSRTAVEHTHELSNAQLKDTEWMIRFHKASVFLHFPCLDGVSAADVLEDLGWVSKRLLTTSYPTAQPNSAASTYYISILTRAPMTSNSSTMRFQPAQTDDNAHNNLGSHSIDGSSMRSSDEAERMFFDSLPNKRFWEKEMNNGERRRVFNQSPQQNSADAVSSSPPQPDTAIFESLALANSGMVVTVHLPMAALHLAKTDYDLVMFLYTIYTEVMDPPSESTGSPEATINLPHSMSHSSLSTQEEKGDNVHHIYYRHPSTSSFHEGAHGNDGDDDGDDDDDDARSDSFSSDWSSDMFESVVGSESVILPKSPLTRQQSKCSTHGHHSKVHALQHDSSSTLSGPLLRPQSILLLTPHTSQPSNALLTRDSLCEEEHKGAREEDEYGWDGDDPPLQPTTTVLPTRQDAHKHIFFGDSNFLSTHPTISKIDELEPSETESNDINPAVIFDRAHRISNRLQLSQPVTLMSSMLPSISDLLQQSSTLVSSNVHSITTIDSCDDDHPNTFHSILAPPAQAFDTRTSANYSHLPPHPAPSYRMQYPTQCSEVASHAQLQSVTRPAPRRGNVPFPITSASAFPAPPTSAAISPARPPSFYRHFMSLRLNIQRASLVLQEDPVCASATTHPEEAASSPLSAAQSDTAGPHSYHIDIGKVHLFQVVEYNGQPTAYIAVRAGDLTLREYKEAILDEHQLFVTPSIPILFKTMWDEQRTAPMGQPLDLERKHDDEDHDAAPSAGPLASVNGRHAFEASSSAWRNPVLLVNVVIKLDTQLDLRDTQTVINLRALTLQFDPGSEWIQHLTTFFTPTVHAPPTLPSTFNVAAPAHSPPSLPLARELFHIHLHGYDVSIDYNPVSIDPRAVVAIDHVHLSRKVFPDSTRSELKIEVRDVAVFMTPYSSKARPTSTVLLSELGQPFLHRVNASTLFQHLEQLGYARLATLDVLDVVVIQNTPATSTCAFASVRPQPQLDVTVSNGLLSVLTCADSFQVLVTVCTHFIESVQQVQQVAEIDVQFDDSLLDNDAEEGGGETTENKQREPVAPIMLNILDEIDHNAFGADLGVARVYSEYSLNQLELQFNDNYQNEVSTKTSLSLALQAAAEREIERARREALGANDNTSPPCAQHAHANTFIAAADNPTAPSQEQQAKWLTERESYEMFEKDRHQDFIASLQDEDAQLHEANLARERDERRKRREEEAQKKDRGLLCDGKDQRTAPCVLDDHVPLADNDTRTGCARLHPPPDYPYSIIQFMLLNLSVCWRMFGGKDWEMTRANPSPFSNSHPHMTSSSRQTDRVMEVVIRGVNMRFDQYPTGVQIASRVFIALDDIEVHDLITTSPFNHFLCYYHRPGSKGRELGSSMLQLDMTGVRPDPSRQREELRVKLSVLPLRLHVDQDAVEFFLQFFTHAPLSQSDAENFHQSSSDSIATSSKFHELHHGTVDGSEDDEDDELDAGLGSKFQFPSMPSDWIPIDFVHNHPNLIPILHEVYNKYYGTIHASMPGILSSTILPWRLAADVRTLSIYESTNEYRTRLMKAACTAARSQIKMLRATTVREVDNQTYIQSFQVPSKIILCIDWKPNTFDLQGLHAGDYAQLANLLPLENMELELKAVKMMGISSFDRAGMELMQMWAHDLSHHQAHRYLAGVQPIRSMVSVGACVSDLVLLPLIHYKQHGSLKRGMQRGLYSFLKNVSLESMAAAARLAQGAQSILESVDDVLTYQPVPLPSHAQLQFAQQRARIHARSSSNDTGLLDTGANSSTTRRKPTHISKRANPPASAHDGFRQAYESLGRGLQSAASQMIVVPRTEYQKYGSKGAVTSAIKVMPSVVLLPVIGGMEAVSKVLDGITNSIDPRRRKESSDKFKHITSES